MRETESLHSLGWRPFFQSQSGKDEGLYAARVLNVHRGRIEVAAERGRADLEISGRAAELGITVGDWVLVDPSGPVVRKRLERQSLFRRRAAGTGSEIQRIAANVDTLFVVTSANRDFNVARLERYFAIAQDAGVFPVIVITKADEAETPAEFVSQAAAVSPGLLVEALDARDPAQVDVLRPWCEEGQTIALLGSSGVGKSTLVNTLTGAHQATRTAREDDQRGRHTTTSRSMHRLPQGGWLIDTPGMRELQLVDVGGALDDVFVEIAELAGHCRFSDCSHGAEPGCAVQEAIAAGSLDADRLRRYLKLQAEDRRNTATLAERRARDKQFGKMVKSIMAGKRDEKGGKH
jgi:ribosome biogenesis GTPase